MLIDEHIPLMVVAGLRRAGYRADSLGDVGRLGLSDESHMEWALANDYVIVTHDRDYLILAQQGRPHNGILYAERVRFHQRPAALLAAILGHLSSRTDGAVGIVAYL